ncbi:MAG: glycosyltransferase family 4 protein [Fibrobacteria bacterium]|nr:glycosyltransferase family 4 protein [Fibrobacteria bacterium]
MKFRLEHWSYDHPANPWLGGGGAYRDWTLLQAMGSQWETRYVAADFEGRLERGEAWAGTEWVGGVSSPGKARWNWVRGAARRLRSLEESGRLPDLLTTSTSILAPIPGLLRHADRTVFVMHHLVGWNAWRNVGPLAPLCVAYEKALMRRGRHFVVVNRVVEQRIRALQPRARIERIPNGIDASLLGTTRRPEAQPLVVFLGRLDRQMKGLDRLLDSFASLFSRLPGVRLEIAGRGSREDLAWLRARCAEHPAREAIGLRTDISESEKAELLSRAWVFCAPSRFEGWCIAGVEAQACGVPVVASTADGFLDSVRDRETGILVPNDERTIRTALTETLARLLEDDGERSKMGESAREWAGKHTWPALAAQQQAFLESVRSSTDLP